jgi:predicted metalloprotease with PDZ domain
MPPRDLLMPKRLLPILFLLVTTSAFAQAPVVYRVAFPAPEHHYAQIEVTFPGLPSAPLEVRMSRSSPGRYALHEYSKNVFDVHAFDGTGRELRFMRPNPYQWTIAGHDGTVRMVYKVFGNRVDGTYLGIDATHAHMNMPATLMWARGLDMRPARITFSAPASLGWKAATQLFPTTDPWTFTAPNLQYLMDSPTELSAHAVRSFTVKNPNGKTFTIAAAVHHDATDADVDEYFAGVQKIVQEQFAIFGEYPEFDNGTYVFLGDYVPWGGGDGMEHRNSTVVASPASIRGNAAAMLDTVSHEFFHAWNVERIRPTSLEPFNFEEANMSGELWLAEGFTQYYGTLVMGRTGLDSQRATIEALTGSALNVAVHPGHRFRSAVEMSQHAPFTDAATSIDPTNFSYAFINYYGFGSSLALALDLSLRGRTQGKVTLDDYMRAMWHAHGKQGSAPPGLVEKPYTLKDARDRLAEVSDRAFADDFFDRFIEGREVPDFARLLAQAGIVVRKRQPGVAWSGATFDAGGRVSGPQRLVPWGSPAFEAGLDHGDVIETVDGQPFALDALKARKPGETVALGVRRPDGRTVSLKLTFAESPALEAVSIEATGGTLTAAHQAFRTAWLGSKR